MEMSKKLFTPEQIIGSYGTRSGVSGYIGDLKNRSEDMICRKYIEINRPEK